MRITILILVLFSGILGACTKTGNQCNIADFLGVWKGTGDCTNGEEMASFTIFQNTDGTFLTRYSGIILPTTLSGCNISASGASGFGEFKTNYSVTGTMEEGFLNITYVSSGVKNNTCTASLAK